MPLTATFLLTVLAGFAILLFGRSLFWLFVGVVGFIVAFELASQYLTAQPEWVILLIAVLAGLIGALLSVFVQYSVVAVAGFLAGGYLVQSLLRSLEVASPDWLLWVGLIIGGIVGAILVLVVFDWALVLLSAITGATMLVQMLELPAIFEIVIFASLLIIGVAFQVYMMPRGGPMLSPLSER
jgi:hypothetical protein